MDIHTATAYDTYDYRALWNRLRKRTWKLIKIGEAQAARLDAIEAENAELRRQRDMLARRLAETVHERHGVPYQPYTRAA